MPASRRQFLQNTALASVALSLAPAALVRAAGEQAPGAKLNIAGIGVGGMGGNNLKQCAAENIVALCDVDQDYAAKTYQAFPAAKVYRDYRDMLEKQKDIEAVIIATPEHTHAVITMAAMGAGKHVYVQKPMAYSVHEARTMTEAARARKVVTQMGNQGHSGEGIRLVCEWIEAGVIGVVREVDVWTNRPVWPQGIEVGRPKETPPVPATLDWDLWLGPAPYRPYHPAYHPWTWRNWWDFGTGLFGDLGCHKLSTVFKALKLGAPVSIEASSTLLRRWAAAAVRCESARTSRTFSTRPRASWPSPSAHCRSRPAPRCGTARATPARPNRTTTSDRWRIGR
jgi:predicted dehydrogenase